MDACEVHFESPIWENFQLDDFYSLKANSESMISNTNDETFLEPYYYPADDEQSKASMNFCATNDTMEPMISDNNPSEEPSNEMETEIEIVYIQEKNNVDMTLVNEDHLKETIADTPIGEELFNETIKDEEITTNVDLDQDVAVQSDSTEEELHNTSVDFAPQLWENAQVSAVTGSLNLEDNEDDENFLESCSDDNTDIGNRDSNNSSEDQSTEMQTEIEIVYIQEKKRIETSTNDFLEEEVPEYSIYDELFPSIINSIKEDSITDDEAQDNQLNSSDEEPIDSIDNSCLSYEKLAVQNTELHQQLTAMSMKLTDLQREVYHLTAGLDLALSNNTGYHWLLNTFSSDQIEYLKTPNQFITWSEDTIEKAKRLHNCCGIDGYKELLKQNLPFPSLDELNKLKSSDSNKHYTNNSQFDTEWT